MSLSFGRRVIVSGAAVLGLFASGFADFVVDDFEHGRNGPNKLGFYWYMMQSNDAGTTIDVITNFSNPFVPVSTEKHGGEYAAGITFSGLAGHTGGATIGIGTGLTSGDAIGIGSDIAGVTGVEFWVKGTSGIMYALNVETVEQGGSTPNYNAHGKALTISGSDWTKVTVLFSDLAQEAGWGTVYTFDKTKATKLSWKLKANNTVNAGSFYIDDVSFIGTYETKFPSRPVYTVCTACATTVGVPTSSTLLSDFDGATPGQNALGEYWSTYSNSASTTTPATEPDYTGTGNGSNGALVTFTSVGEAPSDIYVGVGTNLGSPYDASAFTGIYFEYKTSANVDYLKFVVSETTYPISDGTEYNVVLAGTGGTWKAASVSFSNLSQPDWAVGAAVHALNKADLSKLQWGFYDTLVTGGTIAIDNVYFLGASSVRLVGHQAKSVGISAAYNRGVVGVTWNSATQITGGKVSLVNTKGRVVASTRIAKASGNKVTANLGAGKVPTGVYFVRINAKDVNGKKIVQNAQVSIVK